MMNHEIRTYIRNNNKIKEMYRESFSTAEEAYKAYQNVIEDHNKLPKQIRHNLTVARYNDGHLMTFIELH